MTGERRRAIAAQVTGELQRIERRAAGHDSPALARRAALRGAPDGRFGRALKADAALLTMLTLPAAADGGLPSLDAELSSLLDDAMLVASLVSATRVSVRPRDKRRGSLGRDLRRLPNHERAAEHVLRTILGAEREDLAPHLRRAFSLLHAEERGVDTYELICDLEWWSSGTQGVQKRWAFDFWAHTSADDDVTPTENEDD